MKTRFILKYWGFTLSVASLIVTFFQCYFYPTDLNDAVGIFFMSFSIGFVLSAPSLLPFIAVYKRIYKVSNSFTQKLLFMLIPLIGLGIMTMIFRLPITISLPYLFTIVMGGLLFSPLEKEK